MSSYKLKVLLCGPAGVGKTSLIMRYIKLRFQTEYKLTVGVDILTKDVSLKDNLMCTLSIWDIGGQERFSFIRSTFYKGAAGALLVFDLSRAATWDAIKNWRAEIRQFAGDIPFVLVGNKIDLLQDVGEVIDRDECRDYAESENSIYIETSAKNNIAVEESFIALTQKIIDENIKKK
ncbi:MAG: Rab family GTPase [Promethearchaeota archaeon]